MQIPFYNRQVAPQTQSMPRGSMQAAGAVWDAVAGAGQQIANLGEKGMSLAAQIQKKKTDLKNSTDLIKASNDLEQKLSLFKEEAELKTDPKEIVTFADEWSKSLSQTDLSEYSPEVRERIKLSIEDTAAKGRIMAYGSVDANGSPTAGYAFKAQVKQMDKPLVAMQQSALDGKPAIDPDTGLEMSPDKAFEYATKKRMALGTETPESGMKSIRSFGQAQAYTMAYKTLQSNYPKFQETYDPSKLSDFQQQQIETLKLQTEQKIDSNRNKTHDDSQKHLQTLLDKGELSQQDIIERQAPVHIGFGIYEPAIPDYIAKSYEAQLMAKSEAEQSSDDYKLTSRALQNYMNNATKGNAKKVYESMFSEKNKPLFQAKTMADVLSTMNKATTQKDGWFSTKQLSPTVQKAFNEMDEIIKYGDAINMSGNSVVELHQSAMLDLVNIIDQKGKVVTEEDLKPWREKHIVPAKQALILDEQRKRNISKPYVAPTKITTDAEYNNLPSGASFIDPDGKRRVKP